MKFSITHESDDYVILAINGFEVHVFAEEDGLCAQIGKNGIVQTSAEFDWTEKHDNEPQD